MEKVFSTNKAPVGPHFREVRGTSFHGMLTTNLDKVLGNPMGFAITSFGYKGGSEIPIGSFQAKLSHDSVRSPLLTVQGHAMRVPQQCLLPGRAQGSGQTNRGEAGHRGTLPSSCSWKGTMGHLLGAFSHPQVQGSSRVSGPRGREHGAHICLCTHPKGYVGTHHTACNCRKATSHHSVDF